MYRRLRMVELVGTAISGGLTVYELEWDEVKQSIKWLRELIETFSAELTRYAVLGGLK